MTDARRQLREALEDALDSARDSQEDTDGTETGEKLQQLIVSLEQALADLRMNREAQVVGLADWVADWIPDPDDPLLAALHGVEKAAATG